MSDMQDVLKNITSAIKEKVTDFTTIDVVTYTGTLSANVTGNQSSLDPTTMFDQLKAAPAGDLSVVALTHLDFDLDTCQFVAKDADPKLIALHNDAVLTATRARAAVIDMIKGLL